MTSTNTLTTSEDSHPSNVVPFPSAGNNPQATSGRPARTRTVAQARTSDANAVEREPLEQRLARRIERVLGAILYHAVLESGDLRGSTYVSIEERLRQVVSRDRLMAIARAAINLGLTADLTRLAAAAIVFELQAQSRWPDRMRRAFSLHRRQSRNDTLAIARMLAWDLEALKVRPIDRFAQFL